MKTKIYWNSRFKDLPRNDKKQMFDSFYQPAMKSCSWFNNTPPVIKTIEDSHKQHFQGYKPHELLVTSVHENIDMSGIHTVRTCSGIRDLLNNTYVVTMPFNFSVSVETFSSEPSGMLSLGLFAEVHHPQQYKSGCMSNKSVVKFSMPFVFASNDKDLQITFMQPSYHKHSSVVEAASGIVSYPYTQRFTPNIQTLVNDDVKGFTVNEGEAICYMHFNKPVEFVLADDLELIATRKSTFKTAKPMPYKPEGKWWNKIFRKEY